MKDDKPHVNVANYLRMVGVGFMCADVKKCIKNQANFAAALCLVTYTEVLGAIYSGKIGIEGGSGKCFLAGLGLMEWNGDATYYSGFKVRLQGEEKELGIFEAVRCGLVHEYFGKGMFAVHNFPDLEECPPSQAGVEWIEDPNAGRMLRFNTNAYLRDFESAIVRLMERVESDELLNKGMEEGLIRVMTRRIV
jgi:hypothetical protein